MAKAPDAFRTISEVADQLDTPAHVLRFWESKFTQVKPVKRAGGRRYYRPDDVALLGGIKALLHDQGMTIKGAQKMMRERGIKVVMALGQPDDDGMVDAIDMIATPVPPAQVTEAKALRDDPATQFDGVDNVVPLAVTTPDESPSIAPDTDTDTGDGDGDGDGGYLPAAMSSATEPMALPPTPSPRPPVQSRVLADLARMDRNLSATRAASLAAVVVRLERVHAAMAGR